MNSALPARRDEVFLFKDNTDYIEYCLNLAKYNLCQFGSISEIKQNENDINVYENLYALEELKDVCILDKNCLTDADRDRALKCIFEGKLFSEHAFAGEATRLGLGTKYLINISRDLSIDKIAKLISREKGVTISKEEVLLQSGCYPEGLLPLSLGTRHMLQFSFDIVKLAKKYNHNPKKVLSNQKMLIVLNELSSNQIINEFMENKFFGFDQDNIFFMVQEAYHGINIVNGRFIYDETSPKRLHNHGQLAMQQTMDYQIFIINNKGQRSYLTSDEVGETLKQMDDKISYNVEDLGYLIESADHEALALALKKGKDGYRMLMEIVNNNSHNPQKGGMAAFDNKLGRNVIIEGFRLKSIKNHEIKFLNKNFNHYPKPYESWLLLKEYGLNMPVSIKNGYIYYQPVQGDINFLVKTEFFRRKKIKPINAWKSPSSTPLAIKFMRLQDLQTGFKKYSSSLIGSSERSMISSFKLKAHT
ncbi:MAG: hypothetical protein KKC46_01335 [Proteobacteria bacterium]|nr:hypothetical protein [Pseudomonadota bacterium]